MLLRLERIKGTLIGFIFLVISLFIKTILKSENMISISLMILLLITGPTVISYIGKNYNRKTVKT